MSESRSRLPAVLETERAPAPGDPAVARAPERSGAGRRRFRQAFWALVVLGLLLRVAFVLATPNYAPVHDDRDYERIAGSVARGNGYPSDHLEPVGERPLVTPAAYRPPGWPYTLGGIFAVFGRNVTAARVFLAVLGAGVVALIGLLALQLWGRRASLWATALAALYVPLGLIGSSLLSETLFIFFELAAIAAALAARRRESGWRWALLAGLFVGLAALTRFNGPLLLLPVALLVWTGRPRRRPASLARPLAAVVVAVATVAPWTIRNAIEIHAFIPVTTEAGGTLAGTYNRVSRENPRDSGAWTLVRRTENRYLIRRAHSGAELDRNLRGKAFRFAWRHPGYVAQVAWFNTRQLLHLAGTHRWDLGTRTIDVSTGWGVVAAISFWVVLLLALGGLATRAARRAPPALWLAPALLLVSAVFVIGEAPRFRAPIDPFVLLLAGLGASAAVERWGARRRRVAPAA